MSDILLNHARTAFEHHDWATLVQDIREFLSEQTLNPSTPRSLNNGTKQSTAMEQSSPAQQGMIQLAVQALAYVDFQTRWELVSLIVKFGAPAIAPLVGLLDQFKPAPLVPSEPCDRDPAPTIPSIASESISENSPISSLPSSSSLYPIEEDEEEEDWDLLWFISRILGDIHHPDAIAALIQVLQTSPSEDVVTAAIMALAQQGMAAITPLTQLLNHTATKLLATQALAQIFAKEPTLELRNTLITITQDADPAVRAVVIEALSHSHQPQVTDLILTASDDVAARVRRAAIIALGIQSKQCEPSLIPIILKHLEPRLWDLDMEVRRQTAIALGRIQTLESAELLLTALAANDFPAMLKPDVVRALIWTNTQTGLDLLSEYLVDHHPKAPVYQEIAIMLGRVESPQLHAQATAILLDLLHHHGITQQSVIIKQSIAMSLGQLKKPEAEEALVQLSQDGDERVKLHAIAALKTLKGEWPN